MIYAYMHIYIYTYIYIYTSYHIYICICMICWDMLRYLQIIRYRMPSGSAAARLVTSLVPNVDKDPRCGVDPNWSSPRMDNFWLVVWNIFYFSIYWVANHPNWLSYFSEGWPNHQPGLVWAIPDENEFRISRPGLVKSSHGYRSHRGGGCSPGRSWNSWVIHGSFWRLLMG